MQTHFTVFGEPVEILLSSVETNGHLAIMRQTVAPGGGPPPHMHTRGDEVFSTVSGRFKLLVDGTWTEIPADGVLYAPRGSVHTFRNSGSSNGVLQIISTGGNFDVFLQGLSKFTMPQDIQAVVDYSLPFGTTYPTLPPPTEASV